MYHVLYEWALSNLVNSWNLTTNAFNQEEWMAKTSFFHLLFTNWRILASATHCRKKNVFAFFLALFYITIVWPCSNIGKFYRKNHPLLKTLNQFLLPYCWFTHVYAFFSEIHEFHSFTFNKVQILLEGHKIWKKTPIFFSKTSKQSVRFFFNFR